MTNLEPSKEIVDGLKLEQLTTPFQKIAMALSGGGFRAASFSIGAMSYLESIHYKDENNKSRTLLENVEFISSASGGTFAGMYYAARVKEGAGFKSIYQELLSCMGGQSILKEALENINNDAAWTGQHKTRNFINAFAKAYDKLLFGGRTFGIFWDDPTGTIPIKRKIEVCFNATEFYRGISFRFQTTGTPHPPYSKGEGKIGNNYIYFDPYSQANAATLRQIKLGDIVAASSCFPAGFEPIVYPQDFSYPTGQTTKELTPEQLRQAVVMTDYNGNKKVLTKPFGLMDGGVDDNQGVYSAMLADKRRRELKSDNGFDLILVTDVASYFMDPYKMDKIPDLARAEKKNVGSLASSLLSVYKSITRTVNRVGVISLITLLLSLMLIIFAGNSGWRNLGILLLSPSILLLVVVAFVLGLKTSNPMVKKITSYLSASPDQLVQKVKEALPATENFSDDSIRLLLQYLKDTPLEVLRRIIGARINSTLSLVLDINLKQTRRLIFEIFHSTAIWSNRRVSNFIYELSSFNSLSRAAILQAKFDKKQYKMAQADSWSHDCQETLTNNCADLNAIAENARTMGTTLWFDGKDMDRMKDIVACGQFTTCVKLLEYVMIIDRIMTVEAVLPDVAKSILLSPAQMLNFQNIKQKLEADWKRFRKKPHYLYNEYSH